MNIIRRKMIRDTKVPPPPQPENTEADGPLENHEAALMAITMKWRNNSGVGVLGAFTNDVVAETARHQNKYPGDPALRRAIGAQSARKIENARKNGIRIDSLRTPQ